MGMEWEVLLKEAQARLIWHDYDGGLPLLNKALDNLFDDIAAVNQDASNDKLEEGKLVERCEMTFAGLTAIFATAVAALKQPDCPLNDETNKLVLRAFLLNSNFIRFLDDPKMAPVVTPILVQTTNLIVTAIRKAGDFIEFIEYGR